MSTPLSQLTPPLAMEPVRRWREELLLSLPVASLLLVQVLLFIWTAPRGLDFTDESFYLLNYLHWRNLAATATFFGAYFEGPFRLLGEDVGAMRMLGMALLLSGGAALSWRVTVFGRGDAERLELSWPFVMAGTTTVLFYFNYLTTLRTPSYNLLVLSCMLGATAALLALLDARSSARAMGITALVYGVLLGACACAKATSALAMGLAHAAFVLTRPRPRRWPLLAGLAVLGLMLNLALLQSLQPRWLSMLREGVALTSTLDGRYATAPLFSLGNSVLRGAERLLPALCAAAAMFLLILRRSGVRRDVLSILVPLLMVGIMATIQFQGYGKSWWALLLVGSALLWMVQRRARVVARGPESGPPVYGLTVLLFSLPVAYSVGTNGSLPGHTQMAAIFGMLAVMQPLRRLFVMGLLHPAALAVSLAAMCVPPLLSQLRSLSDPSYTYRLRDGLLRQGLDTEPAVRGGGPLTDALTRDDLALLGRTLRDAGYRRGDFLLDVTGDSPGLVYEMGGRPVGVAWLIGGSPGSEGVAARVLKAVPADVLQHAWILSSEDNPRALQGWKAVLAERTDVASHREAGSMVFHPQYRWRGGMPQPITLTVHRPADIVPAVPAAASRAMP